MTDAPRQLRTSRLRLRRPTEDDLSSVLELQANLQANRYTPPLPTHDEIRAQFTDWLAHWSAQGFGHWMIFEAASDTFVGLGGVQLKELDSEQVLNLFFRFWPSMWGLGYAPEMTTAVLEWAHQAMPSRPVVMVTNLDNTQACRVAEKTGFREYQQADYRGTPARYFRHG